MCKASSTILTYAIDACAAQLAYVGVSNTTIGGPDVTLSSSATEALVMALLCVIGGCFAFELVIAQPDVREIAAALLLRDCSRCRV